MRDQNKGWIDDPKQLEKTIDSCAGELKSDKHLAEFLLQLRYARPTNVDSRTGSATNISPTLDGLWDVTRQIGYNQFMEVSDACTARICQPLRPRVIPVAAKPDIARLCTLLNRLQDGVLDACSFLAEATQAWDDSYCWPIGAVLFEIEQQTREIRCHRADPRFCYYHRVEGRNPIHFYMVEAASRNVLIERYPDLEEDIMRAPDWAPPPIIGVDPPAASTTNTVKLCRGWRRKFGAEPGRYVEAVGHTVLNGDGEGVGWPYDFFPVAVFRNRWDYNGFGGVPMGRYIAPHHIAINTLARVADDSFKAAVPILMSHKDCKVNEMSDVPVQIMKWEGSIEPRIQPTNPVSEQVLRRIDYHDLKSYAIAGINKALAGGQAPKGVVAAVAMREIIQLADARAAEYQKHWEEGWKQAGHIIVAFANELKKVKVRSKADANSELMEEIDVAAIKLDRNDYRIAYRLASALSKSVSGLLSDLSEFKDLGFVDTVDMAEAIADKVPDLQGALDRVTAHKRLAAKMVQTALEEGQIPVVPSVMQGQQGLDAIIILGQQAWSQAMINPDRYSPENLEALRRLMKVAAAKKAPPAPAPQTVAPGAPIPEGAAMTVGMPSVSRVAHNQYEAASMGITPGAPQTG